MLLLPSVELLGAADLLGAGAGADFSAPLQEYARAVERACAPYRGHPAVALNAKLDAVDPSFFQRRDLLLKRTPPPELEREACWSSEASDAERSGEWEEWLAAMRDFARATRFSRVFESAAPLLRADVDGLRRHVAAADYAGAIERYTGLPYRGRYRLAPTPLCARGQGLNRVWTRDDGGREIVSVLKPDRRPSADRAFGDRGIDAIVWHELCHGVMDMTVDLYDYDEKDSPLDLGPGMGHNCRNWLHGIREHLVRAVMLRLIALASGEEESARQFDREEFKARPHLRAFTELLREYEGARGKYPTLAHFYHRLRASFPPPAGRPVTAGAFLTPAQRELALGQLELLIGACKDERLLRRREALSRLSRTAPEPATGPAGKPGSPATPARAARSKAPPRSKSTRASRPPSKRR